MTMRFGFLVLLALVAGAPSRAAEANLLQAFLGSSITLNSIQEMAGAQTKRLTAQDGSGTYHVQKAPLLTTRDLKHASVREVPEQKKSILSITLTETAAEKMRKYTRERVGRRIALLLGTRLMKAPKIGAELKGQGIELDVHNPKDAQLIAQVINAMGKD